MHEQQPVRPAVPERRHDGAAGDGGLTADPAQLAEHVARLALVEAARERLRRASSVSEVADCAVLELCSCCGFDRAVALRIDGEQLSADLGRSLPDAPASDALRRSALAAEMTLAAGALESRAIRGRGPVAGPDARYPSAVADALGLAHFVVAPVVPEEAALLLLVAERSAPAVDELETQAVGVLAAAVAGAIERVVLIGRLRAQGDEVRRMAGSVEAVVREVADAPISLPWQPSRGDPLIPAAEAVLRAPETRLDVLLTRREIEVLDLMAGGGTNRAIAERLGVSVDTVKSHVARILRKLRAANRAEAVSRYLRLARHAPGG